VILTENIRIIYHAPNNVQFASCPKLFEFRVPKSSVDRIGCGDAPAKGDCRFVVTAIRSRI
jgi:hypothetical protein